MIYTTITYVSQRPHIHNRGFSRSFDFMEGPLTPEKEADTLAAAASIYPLDAVVEVTFTTVVDGVPSARTVRVQG
jgi:hypothetical protein